MNVGDIVQGQIREISKTHFIADVKGGWTGLVHVSKISDYFVTDISLMFNIGDKYYFEVIEIEEEEKRIKLSWKNIMPRFQKDAFEFDLEETPNGFKNLNEFVEKRIEEELSEND